MSEYRQYGFPDVDSARHFLYDIWRSWDLDNGNANASPTDATPGISETWRMQHGFIEWTITTPKADRSAYLAGAKQYPAVVVFAERSMLRPDLWSKIWATAQFFGGEGISG
jgi:hypothetical protein